MDDLQKELLIKYLVKNVGEEVAEKLLLKSPLTGQNGLRRLVGEMDHEYFCLAYLPDLFDRKLGTYAKEIMETLDKAASSKAREKIGIIAPRGHGKSTIGTVAIPVRLVCYKKKKFILFVSSNGDTACNFLAKCSKALTSPVIIEDFGHMKGKVWNSEELNTSNGIWIIGTGWESGIRGLNKDRRPDLLILDDLESKKTIESPSMRQKLENCFKEEISRLGDYDTDIFYVGTLLAHDSLLSTLRTNPAWKMLFYQAVTSFPENEHLWEEWRKIFRNIENVNRQRDAYAFYVKNFKEMIKGTSVLWPDKYPIDKTEYKGAYYNIMLMREEFGEDSFWKEDQNEPRNASDRKFTNLSYWETFPYDRIKGLKLAVDPSEGKKDKTAYVVGGESNGGYYILNGEKGLHNPYEIMNRVCDLIKQYPDIEEIIFESNLFKDLLRTELIKKLCENGVYRPVVYKHAQEKKHIRIMKMEPEVTSGRLLFNPLNVDFNNEIRDYSPTCDFDDCADATQMLVAALKKPTFFMA